MKDQRLTEQELQEFQAHKQESNRLAALLGELHYQRILLDFEVEDVKESIRNISSKQREHLQQLGIKYGNGVINPQTGEITNLPSN